MEKSKPIYQVYKDSTSIALENIKDCTLYHVKIDCGDSAIYRGFLYKDSLKYDHPVIINAIREENSNIYFLGKRCKHHPIAISEDFEERFNIKCIAAFVMCHRGIYLYNVDVAHGYRYTSTYRSATIVSIKSRPKLKLLL